MISRRIFIGGSGAAFAAACAPAAAPSSPQAGQAPAGAEWEREWNELVAAAKKEGAVNIFTTAGAGYRKWVEAFEAAFPGIQVQHLQLPSSAQLAPRILEERKAGVYEFDILISSVGDNLGKLRPEGVLEPLRPLLFRPDVLDEKAWRGGFEANWADNDKKWGFPMQVGLTVWAINTDMVKEEELKEVDQLLDPKWKGKITMRDVRDGSTFAQMTGLRLARGEETLRRLIVDQQPFFTRDTRQILESLVRGRYAIANNINKSEHREFLEAGLGKNVKQIRIKDAMHISSAGALWAVNKAPHPNAAKLLANWILTKESMEIYSKSLESNVLRADVEVQDPVTMPDVGVKYFSSAVEDGQPELVKTQQLLNDWVLRGTGS